MRKKKLLLVGSMFILTMSMLTGCGDKDGDSGKKSGKEMTAVEVMENYQDSKNKSNFEFDMNLGMDMEMSAEADGQKQTISMPITFDSDGAILDKNMHMTANIKTSIMDETVDEKIEAYIDLGDEPIMYACETSDGVQGDWYFTSPSDGDITEITSLFTNTEDMDMAIFENATAEFNKEAGTYTVKVPFSDIAESEAFDELMNSDASEGFTGGLNGTADVNDIIDSFTDKDIIYVFDTDFNLTELTMDDLEYSTTMQEEGMNVSLTLKITLDAEFTNHGKVSKDAVTASDEIIENAVPQDEVDYDDEYDEAPGVDITDDIDGNDEIATEEESEEGLPDVQASGYYIDSVGEVYINDVEFTSDGLPLSAFTDNGWTVDVDDDGKYSFLELTHSDDASMMLQVSGAEYQEFVTSDMFANGGICKVDMQLFTDGATYPFTISYGGETITFQTDVEDVITAYGQPTNVFGDVSATEYYSMNYETNGNSSVTYNIEGGKVVGISVELIP